MERLRPCDYEAVLGYVRQLNAVERLEAFPRRAMAGLSRLIESDIITYNEIDTRRRGADFPDEPAGIVDYARTPERHPRKISHFLTLSQFHNLALHSEFFRRLGLNYQMAVTIPSTAELVIAIALNRSRTDFSERDRAVLEAIRPHLTQAYRNATQRRALEERAEVTERALWSSPAGDLASLTRREHDVLLLVAGGKTNQQIAACLSLSPRTVQKHLEHIYDKVGARNRTAAAMTLASTGR